MNAGPPAWVKSLSLPSGQRRFLVSAWGWGPVGNESRDAKPLSKAVKVTAPIWTIGAHSGQSRATAAKHSVALCAAGWMRRDGAGDIHLAAWRYPHLFDVESALIEGVILRDGDDLVWLPMRACPDCVGASCTRCLGSGIVAVTRSTMCGRSHRPS